MFSLSRERKARLYDGLAVALLMVVMMAFGVIVFAASAKADSDTDAWAAEYGPAICLNLDDHNSVAGMAGTGVGVVEYTGMSYEQAGEVIAISVFRICPRHIPLLERFIAVYGSAA